MDKQRQRRQFVQNDLKKKTTLWIFKDVMNTLVMKWF